MGQRPASVRERLDRLGCLPPIDVGLSSDDGGNLIHVLTDAWAEWRRVAPRNRRSRAVRIASWLSAMAQQGAELSFGCDVSAPNFGREWLSSRLCFWPTGIPRGKKVGVASSRIPRNLSRRQPVFVALRTLIEREPDGQTIFVMAENSPLSTAVTRCCELFDRPQLSIHTDFPRNAAKNWLDHLVQVCRPGAGDASVWRLFVSQPTSNVKCEPLSGLPDRDVVVSAISNRLTVLSLRKNGHWERIARLLLSDEAWKAGNLRIAGTGCPSELLTQLQHEGAVPWHLHVDQQPAGDSIDFPSLDQTVPAELMQSLRHVEDGDAGWLLHWTRPVDLTIHGESDAELMNRLLLGLPEAQHTGQVSLSNIVTEMRIRATNTAQRDRLKSVSFTGVPLVELIDKRAFRPHRQRWDFEHTGIAIRRRWLEQSGARPVVYGDDATWNELPEGERPWFQKRYTETSSGMIDWSEEREWRFPGDVDLNRIGPDDVFLFCPDAEAAAFLGQFSRWPIVRLDELLSG